MKHHLEEALQDFTGNITIKVNTPAAVNLFVVDEECQKLNKKDMEIFHSIVAKLPFVGERARPDIMAAIAFLTTRVSRSDEDNWKRLERLLSYVHNTHELKLTPSAESMSSVKWWVDTSYGVHQDMKSHAGGSLSLGRGVLFSKSTKQKLNSKSSTEAELATSSEVLPQILWTRYSLEDQGVDVRESVLYQDNTNAIQLERNGKASGGQRTTHINIIYFFIKDRVESREVTIMYCPTEDIIADFFTKPLQGIKFIRFRKSIMGFRK